MKYLLTLFLIFANALKSEIFNSNSIVQPEVGQDGMVVSQHYLATDVGYSILKSGGNAYDASIAVAFALAVVLPRAGNIGGGGFMVMYDKKSDETFSIDYREKAPEFATKDMFLNDDGSVNTKRATQGILSIGVPGTVYGMWEVHQKFGSLPWEDLIKPAINLAEKGFKISPFMTDVLNDQYEKLSNFKNFKRIFYSNYPVKIHQELKQPNLARTLKKISQNGAKGFYEGEVANLIAQYMNSNKGLISSSDLKNYRPVWRKPITGNYHEYKIVTMAPPSSGGIHIIQMLNILEKYNLLELGHNSPKYSALLSEVMKYAYADRSKYLGDPDFFKVPVKTLISKEYAEKINKKIQIGKITPANEILPGQAIQKESMDTTHFSIADKFGNLVSAPGIPNQFGLLGGEANKIEPYKRPLSSMTPTLVFKDNQPILATGSPGGSYIITAVLQFLLNTLNFKMEISDATVVPRLHHQWKPDVLMLEHGFDVYHAQTIKSFILNCSVLFELYSLNNFFCLILFAFLITKCPGLLIVLFISS